MFDKIELAATIHIDLCINVFDVQIIVCRVEFVVRPAPIYIKSCVKAYPCIDKKMKRHKPRGACAHVASHNHSLSTSMDPSD
jgi:hypothetical protein